MTQKLQPVRGTHDALPEQARQRRHLVERARDVAERYGFEEVQTPVFEFTEVFHRTLGDTSDVVTKETYTFDDRGGSSLTLRPEFTASVVRAFLTAGLQQNLPVKWFYAGPAFRYERPQKGRMRQFHQIGVELLGSAEPLADVESIALAHDVLAGLGLKDSVSLELNTLGDKASRAAYRETLVAYYGKRRDELSEDSRLRLEKNPLRILDSKDAGDRRINAEAPSMAASLSDEAKGFFDAVQAGLEALGIAARINSGLVRGLDYYTHTVFEFTTEALGAQNTVLAGGRYDGLIAQMGGPDLPGIGWAAGVERLEALIDFAAQPPVRPRRIALVPIGEVAERAALLLAHELRGAGLCIEMGYSGAPGKRLKKADQLGAAAAVIMGEDELAEGRVLLRDLKSGEQRDVARADLVSALTSL